ncbi:hypothetical protein D3C85_1440590 [compost metagenome]
MAWEQPLYFSAENPARRDAVAVINFSPFDARGFPDTDRLQDLNAATTSNRVYATGRIVLGSLDDLIDLRNRVGAVDRRSRHGAVF